MSSDAQPAQSQNFPARKFPTELGALGGVIALWAALCAVASTEAGHLVGSFIGFGASLLALPLALLGFGNLTAVIFAACIGLAGLTGLIYIAAGLIKPHLRPLTIRGVHFIGFIAALMLAVRSLPSVI
jgi:hypothetical protein